MKKQNGMTLISLIIYIIALLVVMAVITMLTGYFYNNVNIDSEVNDNMTQFTQFNSYFASEINTKDIKVLDAETSSDECSSYIAFSNKNTYTFSKPNAESKGAIYFNEVQICNNVDKCLFTSIEENGKYTITVDFQSGSFKNTITYTTK